jgi:hypothetical protein
MKSGDHLVRYRTEIGGAGISPMKRIRVGVPFLVSVMCLFVSACALTRPAEDTVFADDPRGAVLLQRVDDPWFTTAHPASVSPLLLTHVLRGVQVQTVPEDATTEERVFSDEETAFLSPLMSTALSKATKNQLVAFRVTQGPDLGGATTGGLLFTRGRILHLWLTHYRALSVKTDAGASQDRQARNPQGLAPRQLRFVPETVQQPNRNQQPDVIAPPPLATLVIDYTMLATTLNLPSEAAPSQPPHGDGPPRKQADTQSVRPGHDRPPSHDIPPSPANEETQSLKDVVKEQAIELDALKEDVRALRQRLSEMEPHSPQLTAPPKAPARRERTP